VGGISTRKVDALVAALGIQSGISRPQVSRICVDIDVQVQRFLNRPLEGGYAYVYLDATYLHVHQHSPTGLLQGCAGGPGRER